MDNLGAGDQVEGTRQEIAPRELLLLRHGIAEERAPGCVDSQRALTGVGRERTSAVLQRLLQLDLRCQLLISSPLLRARQTAELAVAAGLAPELQLADRLAPQGDPWPLLCWPPGVRRLALVGHEPDLGDLAAVLIGARPSALVLKKAGIALLQLTAMSPRPRARLRLLLGPAQLLVGN
jgi:phosphohistidine phosphatase